MDRKTYLGSSDISAIVGLNPYETALDVYNTKVNGQVKEPSEAMTWGLTLEDSILEEFCKQKNLVIKDKQVFTANLQMPYIAGTADAIIENGIIEVKNVGYSQKKKWLEGVPDMYQIQCQYLMGLNFVDKCEVVALVGGQKLIHHTLKADFRIYEHLVKVAWNFWTNYILKKVPPSP